MKCLPVRDGGQLPRWPRLFWFNARPSRPCSFIIVCLLYMCDRRYSSLLFDSCVDLIECMCACANGWPIVLAYTHHIPILRSPQPRPFVSCFLPPTLLPTSGRILRPFPRLFLLATLLRHELTSHPLPLRVPTIPWPSPLLDFGLHMESPKPRHPTQLFGVASIHSAIPAMGVDGVPFLGSWHRAQG